MKHGKRLVALFMSLSLIANHTSTVIALGDEYKRLFIEQSLNAPNITWDTKDEVIVGTAFDSMKGVKAIDDKGNDITDKVKVTGSVDTSKEGEYVLTYSIADSEEEPITRVVRVIPNPEFNVSGSDYVRTYKGEEFDYKQGLTVTDSKGNDITSSVTCEGNVDVNKLGSYNLKYYVPDKKEPILERTVDVIEKNVFNVYLNNEKLQKSLENYNNWLKDPNKDPNKPVSIEKDLAFSIYLDNKTSKFALENQSSEKLDVSIGDEVFANIKVFDKDNNEKLSIELLGSDTGNSEKLDKLKELTYEYGDYISIVTRDSKNCLDITGTLTGDIDNTKEDCKEYYSDGVDNLDYIKNVRFNIVKEGIKTVYNNAPVITGLTEMEKLLTTRDEQLKGISITDDKDTYIPLDEVVITEEKDGDNVVGLRYTVCDDWGREASGVRYLKNPQTNDGRVQIEQSINPIGVNDEPSLLSATQQTSLKSNKIHVDGFRYSDNDVSRFVLGFDINTMKMTIESRDERIFDNKITGKYFEMILYNKHGQEKARLTLNGNDKANSTKIDDFVNVGFEYGDQIHLYHRYSSDKLGIKGTVEGAGFTYNSGIQPQYIEKNRFEITRTGLKYLNNQAPVIKGVEKVLYSVIGQKPDFFDGITVNDDLDGTIENSKVTVSGYEANKLGSQTITYTVTDSWGETTTTTRTLIVTSDTRLSKTSINIMDDNGTTTMFSIKFDDLDRNIKIENQSDTEFNASSPDTVVFKIKIFSKAGITKKALELTGSDTGNSGKLETLRDYKYAVGDYIEVWRSRPNNQSQLNSIKVIGEINKDKEINSVDYSRPIDNMDYIDNVRFELGKDTMRAVYNNPPGLEFKSDLSIKRGETFDPLLFISRVTDDHDNLNTSIVRTDYDEEEIYKVGGHKVTYTVKDKWGRSFTTDRTIQVLPKNKLEENRIVLNKVDGNTTKPIITLYFDDVENRLVKDVEVGESISGEAGTDIFVIEIFNSTGGSVAKSVLKANESLNNNSLKEVTDIALKDDYSIFVRSYNKDNLIIEGNIISNKEGNAGLTSNTTPQFIFRDDDRMNNTRFDISDNGLREVYNQAPEFKGVEDISIIKGEQFDPLNGVSVEDDHDKTIALTTQDNVIGEIDTSVVGPQRITYKVVDSWGRATMKERRVNVKPVADENTIEFENSSNQKAFSIGFDFNTMRFTLESTSSTVLDTSNNSDEFYMAVYNPDNTTAGQVRLSGNKTGDCQELKNVVNIPVRIGSQIKLWSKDKDRLSIKGKVDTSGATVTYNDGVSDREYLDNAVFKVTEDGLKLEHNKAPVIDLSGNKIGITDNNNTDVLYKGDDYRTDLLKDVVITDDRDVSITTDKVILKAQMLVDITSGSTTVTTTTGDSIELNQIDKLGKYRVYYSVKDSWYRETTTHKDIYLESSIGRNYIELGAYSVPYEGSSNGTCPSGGRQNGTIARIRFKPDGTGFKIEQVQGKDNVQFNGGSHVNDQIYVISLYDKNNTLTTRVTINGRDTNSSPKLLQQIANWKTKYGDYLKIEGDQVWRGRIQGPVRNAHQDYSQYIYEDDADNTKFYITEEGLRCDYTFPYNIIDHTVIDFVGTEAAVPLVFDIDLNTCKIDVKEGRVGFYDYYGAPGKVISAKLYDSNNSLLTEGYAEYMERGNNRFWDFEKVTLKDGYYIVFDIRPTKVKDLRIFGELSNAREDYSDGINDIDNLKNVRFTFRTTSTGNVIDADYNEAPEFTGVEDKDIYPGEVFSTTQGVAVTDDKNKTTTFTVTGPTSNDALGSYQYTYSATDDWGRTATHIRTIHRRPNVYKNIIELYSKEETSTFNNSKNPDPAFKIGIDNETGKYRVFDQRNVSINLEVNTNKAFSISIYGTDRQLKKSIELNGLETGTSSKLDELKKVDYTTGDYIRVWSADSKYLRVTGNITGDVTTNGTSHIEDYNDGINNSDYMENVAFKVTENNFETIYNDAPVIKYNNQPITTSQTIVREVLFGEDVNLTSGITVTDNEDRNITTIKTIGTVNKDEVGSYVVTYSVEDSWGRVSTADITFKVISKIRDNIIEVYNNSSKLFDIKFDIENNTFNVSPSTSGINNDFKLILRSEDTATKATVTSGTVNSLNDINFSNGDTIQLYATTNSNIKIKGNIEKKQNGESFENSFPSSLKFEETRFVITNKGLQVLRYEEPQISFTQNDIQIIRGDIEALKTDINIGYTDPINKNGVTFEIEDFDPSILGTQTAKYIFKDSWGKTYEKTRQVTVIERNDLERNKVELKEGNKVLVTFEFDTIENKIEPIVTSGATTDIKGDLITITVYDEEGVTKELIKVTKDNLNNLNPIEFDDGNLIGITSYDYRNGVAITGNIKDEKEDYDNGVGDKDNIDNVRFKLKTDGLESIYNNAPTLTITGDLTTFKDENPDLYENVEVSDNDPHDNGKLNPQDNIQIDTDLDITNIGDYNARYTLSDTWGRETSEDRNIKVVSSLENNKIQYFAPDSTEEAFSIYIDSSTSTLRVNKSHTDLNGITRKSNTSFSTTEGVIFQVNLFNPDMTVKKSLTITSTDDTTSVKKKLDDFDNTPFKYGDYIGVYAMDYQNSLKIQGNIDKPYEISEDYSDGIQNADFMNNVRFRIDPDAMYAVYNEAPTMTIPNEPLDVYKGDDYKVYEGVKVSDDLDIDISFTQIYISDEDKENLNNLGEQTVELILTDSWGRSVSGNRTINVKNALERNQIFFSGGGDKPTYDILKVGFNTTDKTLDIVYRNPYESERVVNINGAQNNDSVYYTITLYSSNGTIKKCTSGNGNMVDQVMNFKGKYNGRSSELNILENWSFEYGDYIKFSGNHLFRTGLNGPVRNAREDYSDRIDFGMDALNTKFYIEESGLRAEYDSPNKPTEGKNIIEFVGTEGRVPVKLIIDTSSNIIKTEGESGRLYDYYSEFTDPGKPTLTITLYDGDNNTIKVQDSADHLDTGPNAMNCLNNKSFDDGDYLKIETKDANRIRIYGDVEYDKSKYPEADFTKGFKDRLTLDRSRIYLGLKDASSNTTSNKLHIVSDPIPTIDGIDDIMIPQGSGTFDVTSGVTATDGNGKDIPIKNAIVRSNVQVLTNTSSTSVGTTTQDSIEITGSVNTNTIGLYAIQYKVTNSFGITITRTRTVNVYSTAALTDKDGKNITQLEQGSIDTDKKSIDNYLRTLVVANDPDENDITSKVTITRTDLNPEVPGIYTADYSVTNGFGKTTTLSDVQVEVIRTISVDVPIKVPFQVVTNLIDKDADQFVAGTLNLRNNKTSDVKVYLEGFTQVNSSGGLQIVSPGTVTDWDNLSTEASMKQMALGIYNKDGFKESSYIDNKYPLWLYDNAITTSTTIGTLHRAPSLTSPSTARIGFSSKHGKKFIGGTSRGKFELRFRFE